jgi:hypothetical protein
VVEQPTAFTRKTNSLAIVSLAAGIIGYILPHPFLASIIAVITGHVARGQIRHTGEGGHGLATAGLVLGYIHLLLSFFLLLALVLVFVFGVGLGFAHVPQ